MASLEVARGNDVWRTLTASTACAARARGDQGAQPVYVFRQPDFGNTRTRRRVGIGAASRWPRAAAASGHDDLYRAGLSGQRAS